MSGDLTISTNYSAPIAPLLDEEKKKTEQEQEQNIYTMAQQESSKSEFGGVCNPIVEEEQTSDVQDNSSNESSNEDLKPKYGGVCNPIVEEETTPQTQTDNNSGEPMQPVAQLDDDYDWLTTTFDVMHQRLSGNEEMTALEMRNDLAQTVLANDPELQELEKTNHELAMQKALGKVDELYEKRYGQPITSTIEQTTKDADSFWNKVPIVNWFIDNTTAEDLYEYMEDGENAEMNGKKANDTSDNDSKLFMGVGVTGGAALGVKFGCTIGAFGGPAGSAAGAAVGALLGAGVGFVCGLGKNLLDA